MRLETGDAGGAYGPACDRCPVRAACPGVDPAYAAVHGTAELTPVADATEPASAALARCFAGTGPMAAAAAGPAVHSVEGS